MAGNSGGQTEGGNALILIGRGRGRQIFMALPVSTGGTPSVRKDSLGMADSDCLQDIPPLSGTLPTVRKTGLPGIRGFDQVGY